MEEEKKDGVVVEEEKAENAVPEMEAKGVNEMVVKVKGEKDREYRFHIPFGAPLIEAYNAACNAASEVARLFKEAIQRQKETEEAEKEKAEE